MAKTKIKGSTIKKSRGEKIFEVVVYAIATVFCMAPRSGSSPWE